MSTSALYVISPPSSVADIRPHFAPVLIACALHLYLSCGPPFHIDASATTYSVFHICTAGVTSIFIAVRADFTCQNMTAFAPPLPASLPPAILPTLQGYEEDSSLCSSGCLALTKTKLLEMHVIGPPLPARVACSLTLCTPPQAPTTDNGSLCQTA